MGDTSAVQCGYLVHSGLHHEQAGLERTFIMGTVNHVPKAPDTVTAHMRVDLLEATLLPSAEYSRIGIARDIMRPPRNGYPKGLGQAASCFEEFFNRYTLAVSVHALMEPKEILAFVIGNVKHCSTNDLELSMTWIELKKKYDTV
eukprot:6458242-Amphidinium_carterae.2